MRWTIAIVLCSGLLGCTALVDGDIPFSGDAGPRDAQVGDARVGDAAADAALDATIDAMIDGGNEPCLDGGACPDAGDGGAAAPRFRWVAAGASHTCAVAFDGEIYCWGSNTNGELGIGTTSTREGPQLVLRPTAMVDPARLCAGDAFTCALIADGTVWCWGAGNAGQLGDGANTDRPAPDLPIPVLVDAVAITCGDQHVCALTQRPLASTYGVACWGRNAEGQVGDGSGAAPVSSPSVISSTLVLEESALGAPSIEAGARHTCLSNWRAGTATLCWGDNSSQQVTSMTGAPDAITAPVLSARGGGLGVRGAYTGYGLTARHTCGFLGTGIDCWAQTGELVTDNIPADGSTWDEMSGGENFVCVRAATEIRCWGENTVSQLGSGSTALTQVTLTLSARSTAGSLSAGRTHACAIDVRGEVNCWGDNASGQASSDIGATVSAPTVVRIPTPPAAP